MTLSEAYLAEIRAYDASQHDGLIPLAFAAAVPYVAEAKPYKPFHHLLMRMLNAMVEGELTVFHEETKIPLFEYLRMGDCFPDGTLPELAPFSGLSLVKVSDVSEWLAANNYPFATAFAARFNTRTEELSQRERTTYLNIIATLLECIAGNVPGIEGNRSVKSEAKLIEAISAHFAGYGGISKSNLEKKFAEAKRSIDKQ